MVYRLEELAERVGGHVVGDADREITGIATLSAAGPGDLSFLTHPRYREAARETGAGAVLVAPESGLSGCVLLECSRPYVALARLLDLYHPTRRPDPGISPDARLAEDVDVGPEVHVGPFAVIDDGARLGAGVVVGAGAVVGRDCVLGERTELKPRVVLYPGTEIGRRCVIHAGVVLGADGFGFASDAEGHHKVPQVGRVVVEDDVEIGANTTIDRSMLGETRIGAGSKIDNLVMVAHGVRIGDDALIAAQAGIAGSSQLGKAAMLAGQTGISGHLHLGDRVKVAAKSAVLDDQPEDAFVAGIPAFDHRAWRRAQVVYRKLPGMSRELRDLRARVRALEGQRESEE